MAHRGGGGGGVRLDSSGMMGEQRDVLEFESFPPQPQRQRCCGVPNLLSYTTTHFETERKSKGSATEDELS